jgi:hypothetical protein
MDPISIILALKATAYVLHITYWAVRIYFLF